MDTTIKNESDVYLELQSKIKNHLADYYEMDRIKLEELLAILNILGNAQNYDELKSYLSVFSNSFPVLKDVFEIETNSEMESAKFSVSTLVQEILPINPKLASELAAFASNKNVSFEEVVKAFPEVNVFIKKK